MMANVLRLAVSFIKSIIIYRISAFSAGLLPIVGKNSLYDSLYVRIIFVFFLLTHQRY